MGKIAIDFDDVICDSANPKLGFKMGPPMPDAIDTLQDLSDKYEIIIHSVKANTESGKKAIADWCEYFGVEYVEIVGKPGADIYLDNKALKFTSWDKVRKELL